MDLRQTILYRWISGVGSRLGIAPGRLEEFIKFAMVGGSGVVVNMGCFFLLIRYWGLDIKFASPIAIEVSILTNFFLNNPVPFYSRLLRYHLVTGLAGIVNYFTLLLLANVFGIPDMVANLIGIILGTLINFFLNSMWTWRVTTERKTMAEEEISSGPQDR